MASRSHVDVNERRLRPIYDCLDNGNNKKAIQEADKVLKKQKDVFTCAKVLKALALLRMGRHGEGSAILSAIHDSEPTEEQTLSAMAICYKETQQYPLIASLYESAAKHQPNNEDILSCLFMAHVRLCNYQQQQRTAMALHKLRPNKNPYYFWAVMSIVMQAHKDQKLGRAMFLPLAEKMTQKYIKEDKIEAEAEILLYLIILEFQEKWDEALAILDGPMGVQLGNELHIRELRLANVCTKMSKWDRVNCIYKEMLDYNPDDWTCWLKYLEAGFNMLDQGFIPTPDSQDDTGKEDMYDTDKEDSKIKPDHTAEALRDYVSSKVRQVSEGGVVMRGPYLAHLELLRQLQKRGCSDVAESVGSALKLLQEYFGLFGHKSCCYGDLTLFTDLLSDNEIEQFLQSTRDSVGLEDLSETLKFAQDINQLTRHLVYHELCRKLNRHSSMPLEEIISLSNQLLLRYRDGLKFGKELLVTDLQYSDNYLLLAVHLLLDAWKCTGDDIHLWRAIVHLELGVRESQANFQFKLLLIRLYCCKGVFGPCPALYDGMEIKHIVNDTMGYIVSNHVVRLGHFMEAGTMYTTMVRFFVVNQKEASEHLMSSYKFGSFGRIQEFVEFQDRLDNSLQYRSANTEKMLLDLIIQTDRHDTAEAAADCINPHPNTKDTIDLAQLYDNRDLKIAFCWDPAPEFQADLYRKKSVEEEKTWLLLRYIQLQLLLAAVATGREMSGLTSVNGNSVDMHTDGVRERGDIECKQEEPLEVMRARLKQLKEYAAQCAKDFSEPRQYHLLQGPHRTRIATLLAGPHIELLSYMVDCIVYVHALHKEGLESANAEREHCWATMKDKAKRLLVNDVDGLLKDVDGRRQLDSTALELLVASVESMSYLTLLAGVCNRGLKTLKSSWNKKIKKGKGSVAPQLPTVENFNSTVSELSAITKELHQLASSLDPVFSSIDIASLRLADIPDEEELQREAERLVWSKVERSVQQSSREICEVLHHKQFYLNTLML